MTWFKVDDGFYDHPKVLGLDVAAVGLWTLAGSYCARHLTDGVITDRQIRAIGGTRRQAEKLAACGLWSADDAPPSERRYTFNDWRDFQPTRDETLSKRQEDAERKRKARESRAAKQGKRENVRSDVQADVQGESVLPGHSAPSALPDPARPDPARPDPKDVGVTEGRGSLRSEAPATDSPPLEVPAEWIADPRRARCADHAGVASPPPCRACGDRRQDAERARAEHHRAEERAAAERRAERDACALCDSAGMAPDGLSGLLRCPHDPQALTIAQEAVQRDSERDEEPAASRDGPNSALQNWRHRWRNRTEVLHHETVLPAIDHDPNEPPRGTT